MNLTNSNDGLSSLSMYSDIVWGEKGNEELPIASSKTVAYYAKRFAHGHWSFLGLGSEKTWYGTHTYKPNGKWDRVAEDMMLNFSESGHPVFRGSSAMEQGDLRSKGKGKLSVYCCGDDNTIISVNQLSIYGAEADIVTNSLAESLVVQKVQGNLSLRTV